MSSFVAAALIWVSLLRRWVQAWRAELWVGALQQSWLVLYFPIAFASAVPFIQGVPPQRSSGEDIHSQGRSQPGHLQCMGAVAGTMDGSHMRVMGSAAQLHVPLRELPFHEGCPGMCWEAFRVECGYRGKYFSS